VGWWRRWLQHGDHGDRGLITGLAFLGVAAERQGECPGRVDKPSRKVSGGVPGSLAS
jgi:hypothetical protein